MYYTCFVQGGVKTLFLYMSDKNTDMRDSDNHILSDFNEIVWRGENGA